MVQKKFAKIAKKKNIIFKDKKTTEKGITLVALIVTIVVLLILAGISIASITGNDAPMEKAGHAKNETEIQAEMEEIQDAITKGGSKNFLHGDFSGSADTTSIKTALKSQSLINENPDDVIIEGINGWKVTGKKTGQTYKIMPNGELKRIELIGVTDIYAKLYGDNTLILSSTDYTDPTRTVVIDYGKTQDWRSNKFKTVIIYDKIAPSTCENMFANCSLMEQIQNIENLHTENVTSMERMFYGCNKLIQLNLSNFNTDKVTNMTLMFYFCNNLTKINMNNLNTINVELMNGMFRECRSLSSIDLENINTKNVINMNYMFYNCKELIEIYVNKFWTTKNVDSSNYMFSYDSKLVGGNGTTFNTSKVDKEYAHIDGGSSNPGYFTQK